MKQNNTVPLFFIFLSLFLASGAFAQNHYVDVNNGSGNTCSDTDPCSMTQAIADAASGETIYIRSQRSGDTVTITGDYGPLNVPVNFAAYVSGSTDAVSATLAFTGKFELGGSGKILPHSKITAQFENLLISNGNTNPFGDDADNLGSVTISTLETGFVTINRLQVKSDLVIKRLETATSSPVITIQELEVSQGAALTVGLEMNTDGSDRENPVHLRVPLRQAANADEKFDSLVVHGIIDGAGSLLVVHDNSATGRGASGMDLHVTADYTPTGADRTIDHTDCVKIAGNGEIHNDLYAVAAGNICVTLKKIGRLIVAGSIQADEYSNNAEMITTDVIFREDVEIMGNVEQWNDAKILFEKKATIEGSVILDSGPFSYPVLTSIGTGDNSIALGSPRDNFDKTLTSGDDLIIRNAERVDRQSCWPTYRQYATRTRPLEHQLISGIRFEGQTDIAQDLDLRHYFDDRDNEGTSQTNTGAAQRCLIAVDFWIPRPASDATESQAVTSRIGGDLLADNGGSINLSGHFRITFNGTFGQAYSNHHLELDGDIIADGEFGLSIWEGGPRRPDSFRGECTSTDGTPDAFNLEGASLFVLSDEQDHRIVLSDGNMRMFSLAIRKKVRIQGGNLFTKAIHVEDGGQLISNENVQVGWNDTSLQHSFWGEQASGRLILEGEGLDGTLHPDSHVNGSAYSTTRTDLVDAKLVPINSSGWIYVVFNFDKNAYMRLSDPLVTGNVGLCSGTVILEEPDEADSNTLTINETLYVKDGIFEFDANSPGSLATDDDNEEVDKASYSLRYQTEGARTIGNEWFGNPRSLFVEHKDAIITSDINRELLGRVQIKEGEFHVNGGLTVGTNFKIRPTLRELTVNEDALLRADTIRVHEKMTVSGTVKTNGGDIYSLGWTNDDGRLVSFSSQVSIRGEEGMIDLGDGGTLHLGPPITEKQDGLIRPPGDDGMPFTLLSALNSEAEQPLKGNLNLPPGSKFNSVNFISHIDTLTFDGTATPNLSPISASNKMNLEGILFLQNHSVTDNGSTLVDSLVIDSLSAKNGWVRLWNIPFVKIDKDVELESAILTVQSQLHLKGDLTVRETGSLQFDGTASGFHPDADRFLKVDGDFHLGAGKPHPDNVYYMNPSPSSGLQWFAGHNASMTVLGNYQIDPDAFEYDMSGRTSDSPSNQRPATLTIHGDFHFDLDKDDYEMLDANLEFSGTAPQVITASSVPLGDVVINNSSGLVLKSNVVQGGGGKLTLTRGVISSTADTPHTWTVTNPNIEEDVRGRNNALTTCSTNANCERVITGGSSHAYVFTGFSRHLLRGNSGGSAVSGGYLFPVGDMDEDGAHYRPLILQLEDDLSSAVPVTVTPMRTPEDEEPSWPADNIVVPIQGNLLTLDVHANLFWKVEFKEATDENPHIRIAAGGLMNVLDDSRLRMVQWDCEWGNARLAGTSVVGTDEDSFAENGYVNGVLNLTQENVDVGTCAIFGVAANGIENPIHRYEITGGVAEVQFIHNAVIPVPVDISLDGVPLRSGVTFQNATGYMMVSAGSHQVRIQPVGAPAEQSINVELPTLQADKSYAVIAHGTLVKNAVKTIETRKVSTATNMVEAILVHGSGDAAAVNVNLLDPYDSNQLDRIVTRQLAFDQTTKYLQFEPESINLQVTGADNTEIAVFQLDLSERQGEALILNLSNLAAALEVYGVDVNGDRVSSLEVTSIADAEELPTEFTLHGNYPNPFNPTTRIQFDLPETAQVSLQIVDMLGREVMTLPAKEFEAGSNRSIELNAVNLASGTYLYRMIATGAESRYVKTGRMTLVK